MVRVEATKLGLVLHPDEGGAADLATGDRVVDALEAYGAPYHHAVRRGRWVIRVPIDGLAAPVRAAVMDALED